MSFTRGNIVWGDVETDGLIGHKGHLLEIAILVTDADLNVLDEEGFHAVVRYSRGQKAAMILNATPYVAQMHAETGLWDKLDSDESLSLALIDLRLVEYLSHFGAAGTMPFGGNSVKLDLEFIREHLPLTHGYLDYHMRDVSTVAGFANDWFDLPWFEKHNDHTAMTDIRESIREIKHYRDTVFQTAGVVSETRRLRAENAELKALLGQKGTP